MMDQANKEQKTELEQRSTAINLSVAISAIYIGIASGLLIFVLQKNPDLTVIGHALLSAIFCICSILFHMFAAEFFMLSIWHRNKISDFALYGSICYGIGQAFLFIGISFVVRSLGHKMLSIIFLSLIVVYWVLYYTIRVKMIPETDHISSRWLARGLIFFMYLSATLSLIQY
jgi:hypothetical protein